MKKLIKIGGFSYLLPYIIMPFILILQYHEEFKEAFVYSFLLFFGIESPFVVLYPLSWIATSSALFCVPWKISGLQTERRKSLTQY